MPDQALHGELSLGRSTVDQLAAIVRRQAPSDDAWRRVRFMSLELPEASGSLTERVEQIKHSSAASGLKLRQPLPQFRFPDAVALRKKLQEIVRRGGEGLVLDGDDAAFETGRLSVMFKLTRSLDAEATVVVHLPGKGKFAGMLGALRRDCATA